jgi:gluconolactonase
MYWGKSNHDLEVSTELGEVQNAEVRTGITPIEADMRLLMMSFAAVLILTISACITTASTVAADFVVYDDRFYGFVAKGTKVEVLASDLGWAEGPVWAAGINALLFSDVATNKIYRWDDSSGLSVFLSPSGHAPDGAPLPWRGSNGLAIDREGRLLLAQQGNRTLARMIAPLSNPTPDYDVLAAEYDGKSINSPNDLVVHQSGDIYFTDPPYGLAGFEQSPDIELDFFGVFRLTRNYDLYPVTRDLEKPNGIALSSDQSILYVSNSEADSAQIISIELDAEGNPGLSRVFFDGKDLMSDGPGSTDGMTVHPSDYLFVSIPNGLGILSPTGELLGKISLGQVTNMALDVTSSYLYITTPHRLLRLGIGDIR